MNGNEVLSIRSTIMTVEADNRRPNAKIISDEILRKKIEDPDAVQVYHESKRPHVKIFKLNYYSEYGKKLTNLIRKYKPKGVTLIYPENEKLKTQSF